MNHPKYIYNPKTCQYERARVTWQGALGAVFSILSLSALLFTAIVFLHNRFVETDYERSLRAENKTLKENKPQLEENLETIEATLATLRSQEKDLYTKLFNTPPPETGTALPSVHKEDVLVADASGFRSLLKVISDRSAELSAKSAGTNRAFGESIHVEPDDIALLTSLPSIQPLDEANPDALVSGFGKRVNPFHKGLYLHPGVDLVAPRGTAVRATAGGHVSGINKSELQAGYGNSIVIDHGNGLSTRYAHLEEIHVKTGQQVSKGTTIGTVGNSGGSIAPHLHYEVIRDGEHVDPVLYFIENMTTKQHNQLLERSKKQNQSLD